MLGALAASQEQQRRLVADAGHELRTPLTSMRTNLELLAAANRPGAPRTARVGARGDPRRPAGADHGAVDAGRRPGRAGTRRRAAGRARAGRAHRRRSCAPSSGPGGGPGDVEFAADARCRGRSSATRPRWNGRCSTCSTTPPSGARRAVDGAGADAAARPVVGAARGGRRRARASPSRTCRRCSTASTAPTPRAHDARLRARAGDRAAGGAPARRGGVGRARAGGRSAAGAASARPSSAVRRMIYPTVRRPV